MKKARKKRIVRRKRRISEREIMRIKRKLKKSAKKLHLGAKRTGAYVYGTLRRIVGNGMKTHNEQGQKLYVVLVKGVPLKYQPPFRPGIIYYTKGWAIKKARVFGGEVMSVANYIKYQRDTRREAIRRGYMPKEYLSEAERRLVGNPGGLKILGYRSGMQYLTDGKDVYRRDKMDMKHGGMRWYSTYASFPASIRAYGPLTSPRGLRGNPLSYHVGGLSSLGAKRESQRRMRTYNQIKKSIQRGNASYGELAVLQSLAKEHPKLFAGDPMMAEAGGMSEAQFRRLRGNPSLASLHPRDRATADKFVDYVYGFYGKGGVYAEDFGNRGFTRREIERAVAIYIDQIRKKKTQWGGGDSIDRERVRKILQPSYSFSFA